MLSSYYILNLHRNPKVPWWNVNNGGDTPKNYLAAYKIVPSPPIVTT